MALLHDFEDASALYNSIPHIDTQSYDVSPILLRDLGSVFVRHQLHHSWGPALLHRHYDVSSGMRMVHTTATVDGNKIYICRQQDSSDESLQPVAFFHAKELGFIPYEYSASVTDTLEDLSDSFLNELSQFLRINELESIVGISRLPDDTSDPLYEETRPEILGTVATKRHRLAPSSYVATAWRFSATDSSISIHEVTRCQTPASGGGHLRPPPPPPRPTSPE